MKDKTKEKEYTQKSMEVEIGFPDCVRIELVQSNDLRHYEIFIWLSTLFAAAMAGFWVVLSSSPSDKVLLSVSIILSLFTAVFIGLSFYYRARMSNGKIRKTLSVEDFK